MLQPKIKKIMVALEQFMGPLSEKPYHFIFYYRDLEKAKGMFKNFGTGSALEHQQSSVYYYSEPSVADTTLRYLNWICTHEYLHKIAPLSLGSEKIKDFNFDTPNMSQHLWLYEGVTDYFASQVGERYKLPLWSDYWSSLASGISSAHRFKSRSMTESSQHIIKHNMFDWLSKIMQLSNFYEKGKLIAFCLDYELFTKSNGTVRLIDVIKKMNLIYNTDNPFPDGQLLSIFANNSYPDLLTFMQKHIEGKALPPYNSYLSALGMEYLDKNSKVERFGDISFRYNKKGDCYFVKKAKSNSLNLKKGDTIVTVNEKKLNLAEAYKGTAAPLFWPKSNDTIKLTIKRKENLITLTGQANRKMKLGYSTMRKMANATEKQIALKKEFLSGKASETK